MCIYYIMPLMYAKNPFDAPLTSFEGIDFFDFGSMSLFA
jgi:hypothetical protein